ncbi:MAG: cupredoxin domain-containing protein [Anaerolineales bacterium]
MKKFVFVFVLGLSLILSACGAAKPTTTINVSLTDFQFQPAKFVIPAGKEITLNATNTGAVVHNFVIMKAGTTAGELFDDEDLPNVYWEVEIDPGGEAHVTFTAPSDPGDYQLVCRTKGHLAAGMTGTITVVADE